MRAGALPAHAPDGDDRLRAEILEAIRLELVATRKRQRNRASWRPVGEGRRVSLEGAGPVYAFRPGRVLPVRREQVVELATDQSRTCARVLESGTEELILACFEHVGDPTPPARIRWDATWLLEALHAAIEDLDLGRRHARLLFHPEEPAQADENGFLSAWLEQPTAGLNPGQARAVAGAFGSELSFLWGPPGCGKTTTLSALTEALSDAGRSVLVLGPTNHAVDHLLMAVADRLSARGKLAPGDVLRLGPISSGALERAYGSHVDPQQAAERLVGEALTGTLRPEDQLAAVADLLGRLERQQGDAPDTSKSEDADEAHLRRILLEDLRVLEQEVEIRQHLVGRVRRSLLEQARVVGTTLHRAFLPGQLDRTFDTVIVDEASSAAVPLVLTAAARAERSMVIGGDFRQLPPVCHADHPAARTWMGRTAFDVARLPALVEAGRQPFFLHRLSVQYRMRPEISDFVGGLFYDNGLRTPGSIRERPLSDRLPLGGAPLVHVDTHNLSLGLRSDRTNHWHGFVIARLLEQLYRSRSEGSESTLEVAVLTPYRRQANYLRRQLGKTYGAHFGTVHTAQGQEYDVVILDLPEKGDIPPTSFLGATRLDHTGARLLNVAISRARQQVIVIADQSYFERKTPRNGIYLRVLRELTSVPIWKVSPKLGPGPKPDGQ